MTRHHIVLPEGWPRPKGYANGVLAAAGSRLLTVAGQVGWDENEQMVPGGLVAQFRRSLENVLDVVRAAGGTPEDLLRLTFFVTDHRAYSAAREEIGRTYRELFGNYYPACTLVEVSALLEDGAEVEIEATAAIPPRVPDES